MKFLRQLRVRLTLWYVVLMAITLAVFSAGVYVALREALYSTLDDSLDARVGIATSLVTDGDRLSVEGVVIPGDTSEGEAFTRVYDASGRLVLDNSADAFRPAEDPAAVQAALAGGTGRHNTDAGGVGLRIVTAPVTTGSGTVGAVQVGLANNDVYDTLRILLIIIAVAYPLALIVTTAGGVFLAGRALSPIDRVTRAAARIGADDLSQRLNLDLPEDEVGRLARTFDEMIARLDEAFRRQRQFTADASHELRTPLTAIKGQTEVALQRDREPEAYKQVLRTVNSEVDRMTRLVASLLTLARADAGRVPIAKEQVAVADIAAAAVQQIAPSASAKGVSVKIEGSGPVQAMADEDLLLQLILNLLDNAVKYTPAGGDVTVRCRRDGAAAVIEVSDTGPGIAAEHLPHIFDRFYRADPARTRAEGGAGLGLSICRWIAEAHGGTIAADSAPGRGATFTVRLPAS